MPAKCSPCLTGECPRNSEHWRAWESSFRRSPVRRSPPGLRRRKRRRRGIGHFAGRGGVPDDGSSAMFHVVSGQAGGSAPGQVVARGRPGVSSNLARHRSFHVHAVGRWRVTRRTKFTRRAGMFMMRRRTVAVVALACAPPAMVPAARVRLNAMTARTSQASFAVNLGVGMLI